MGKRPMTSAEFDDEFYGTGDKRNEETTQPEPNTQDNTAQQGSDNLTDDNNNDRKEEATQPEPNTQDNTAQQGGDNLTDDNNNDRKEEAVQPEPNPDEKTVEFDASGEAKDDENEIKSQNPYDDGNGVENKRNEENEAKDHIDGTRPNPNKGKDDDDIGEEQDADKTRDTVKRDSGKAHDRIDKMNEEQRKYIVVRDDHGNLIKVPLNDEGKYEVQDKNGNTVQYPADENGEPKNGTYRTGDGRYYTMKSRKINGETVYELNDVTEVMSRMGVGRRGNTGNS